MFEIDEKTGAITLIGVLDFEKSKKYEIGIEAKDQGGLGNSAKVIVDLIDVNDNAPLISVMSFSSSVSEDAHVGTTIAIFSVKDLDAEENGHVDCTVDRNTPFKLQSSLRNYYSLVTDAALDRERVAEYNITITAVDSGSPALSSQTTLNLKVSDVNDNPPRFQKSVYTTFVSENNQPGLSIFTLSAQDDDWNQNARISYLLDETTVGGSPVSSFISVNADSGVVHALRGFDYEQIKSVRVYVKAQDGGSPPLSTNVTLDIIIQDQNDNAPQVLYPVHTAASVVAEIVPRAADVGYLVTKVVAVDVDSGQNAWPLL